MKFIIFLACPAPSYDFILFPCRFTPIFFQRHQKIRPPIGFPLLSYSTALLFSSIFAKNRYRRSNLMLLVFVFVKKTTAAIAGFVSTTIIATVTIVIIVIIANIVNFATIRCNRSLHYFFCFCSFFLYFYLPI